MHAPRQQLSKRIDLKIGIGNDSATTTFGCILHLKRDFRKHRRNSDDDDDDDNNDGDDDDGLQM